MNAGTKLAIAHEVMSALIKSGHISVINWLYCCDDELPEGDVRVLVAIPNQDGPVEALFCQGIWADAHSCVQIDGVYAWAHIPALPPLPKPLRDEEGPR